MAQGNVEIVRRLYEAMDARDVEAITELVHEDGEWVPDRRVGERPIRGRENVLRFFTDRAEMFGEIRTEVEQLRELDDRVLAFIHLTGRGRASDAPFDLRIAHLWTLRDGWVVRGEGYGSRDEALAAAGLDE